MDDAAQTVPVTKEVRIVIMVGAKHFSLMNGIRLAKWMENLEAISKTE